MDANLICNYRRCQTQLTSNVWITSCFHIFCNEHASSCEIDKKCPLCSNDLLGKLDLYRTNLNPSEEFKSMILAGLSPRIILEIGLRAMAFWKFQMFHEKMYLTSVVRHLRSRLAQRESSNQVTIEGLEDQMRQEAQKNEQLQKELNNHIERSQDLERKIYNMNKQLYNSQMRFETLRRQLQTCDRNEQSENFPYRTNARPRTSPNFVNQMYNLNVDHMSSSQQLQDHRSTFSFHPSASQRLHKD